MVQVCVGEVDVAICFEQGGMSAATSGSVLQRPAQTLLPLAHEPLHEVPLELTDRLSRFLLKTQTFSDDGKFACYGNIFCIQD